MTNQTLSNMRVVLENSELAGRITVPLESFMKFDLQISRELQQLENRWLHKPTLDINDVNSVPKPKFER